MTPIPSTTRQTVLYRRAPASLLERRKAANDTQWLRRDIEGYHRRSICLALRSRRPDSFHVDGSISPVPVGLSLAEAARARPRRVRTTASRDASRTLCTVSRNLRLSPDRVRQWSFSSKASTEVTRSFPSATSGSTFCNAQFRLDLPPFNHAHAQNLALLCPNWALLF
jgi:hypothetical protein